MAVFLVRHADAASRRAWSGDDASRPLTDKGRRQAAGLVAVLPDRDVARLWSSPAARCVATLRPLAAAIGVDVVETEILQEGSPIDPAWELLTRAAGERGHTVLSTHGDLIPDLLDLAVREGAEADPLQWPKGSTWRLEWDGERFRSARYLPPPAEGPRRR